MAATNGWRARGVQGRGQEYQLLWGQRIGFARVAVEAGCPIVPFAAVGAEDCFGVVLDMDGRVAWPVRPLVRRVVHRDDVGTLLVRGSARAGVSGTGRLYFSFGRAIPNDALGRARWRPGGSGRVPRPRRDGG